MPEMLLPKSMFNRLVPACDAPVTVDAPPPAAAPIALAPRVTTPVAPPQRNFFEFNGACCLWPYGHPNDENFRFCGARALAGKPYCAEHAAIAYVRPKEEKAKAA